MKAEINTAQWNYPYKVTLTVKNKKFSRTCYDLAQNQGIKKVDIKEDKENE